jgi:fumarate reductase subunit C
MQSSDVTEVRVDPNGLTAARQHRSGRSHPYRQPFNWWLRRRGYVLYMLREATVIPMVVWTVLFLVEIARLRQGPAGYRPLEGPVFVAVSVVCLAATLWHAYTFLSLAGLIVRIPYADRAVSPRVIVGAMFSGLVLLSIVVGGLLIWGGA